MNVAREDAYDAGCDAFITGELRDECPYADSRLAMDWLDGFDTTRMESEE